MTSDRGAEIGLGILTSFVLDDQSAFNAITSDIDCPMALAALGRVAEVSVKMLADLQNVTREEALRRVALAVAQGGDDALGR